MKLAIILVLLLVGMNALHLDQSTKDEIAPKIKNILSEKASEISLPSETNTSVLDILENLGTSEMKNKIMALLSDKDDLLNKLLDVSEGWSCKKTCWKVAKHGFKKCMRKLKHVKRWKRKQICKKKSGWVLKKCIKGCYHSEA